MGDTMNDKQMQLIQAGIKLFAGKGYYHTSIQEIASEAGVSKGSFYIYFQSKEEFIVKAFRHFYNQISERLDKVRNENLPPKKILAKQITMLMDFIDSYKDFFSMHVRENISIGEDINNLIYEVKEYNFNWMKEMILSIYGAEQEEMLLDTMIQFDGLLNGYLKWIVINDVEVDKTRAGEFITARLDDIVNGMNIKEEKPLTKVKPLGGMPEKAEPLTILRNKLNELKMSETKRKQLQEAVAALETEIRKKEYSPVIIQGLLAHFSQMEEVKEECRQIGRA